MAIGGNTKKVLVGLACVLGVSILAIYLIRPNSSQAEREQYAVYSAYIEDGVNGNLPRPAKPRDIELIVADTIPVNVWNAEHHNTIERWRNLLDSVLLLRRLDDPPAPELVRNLFLANFRTHNLEGRFHLRRLQAFGCHVVSRFAF